VEDPAHPWPNLAGKTVTAGPFYLIWQDAERAGISPEQWPYALASIAAVASPLQRWPSLALPVSLAANAPARRGQAVVFANCFSCHRLGGAGEGDVGPDLLQPMPATTYFTDAGLHALIRNPASVRVWPEQHMPSFDAATISDADIDAAIAYLHSLGSR
jgi:mono/diheme cytochrome c family protein